MKKNLALFSLALVLLTTAHAQWYPFKPDPVITPAQKLRLDAAMPATAAVTPAKPRRVLVFSRTCEFRHNQGIVAINYLMRETGRATGAWDAVVSDDLANFEPDKLRAFDCVVLNNPTGMFFSEPGPELEKMIPAAQAQIKERDARLRDNLIDYVEAGGGLFAIHAGADAYRRKGQYNARFVDMIGGNFVGHPWTSNDTSVATVEDAESPITRELWPQGEFVLRHELYMFGDAFDRAKLRVLLALDMERSAKRKNARADGDCALVWIKKQGKGRVAYSGFGHDMPVFFMPEIQTLHLRLLQFACGDLAADVRSIPKHARKVSAAPATATLYPKPDTARIRRLERIDYGSGDAETKEINEMVFAAYHHNSDEALCAEMGNFLLDELGNGRGTSRYRAMLAQMMEAVGVQNQNQNERLAKLCGAEKDEAVRSRLAEAAAHWRRATSLTSAEKEFNIPPELPSSPREQARLIDWLSRRGHAPLPAYLSLDKLDDAVKPRLVYALVERGETVPYTAALKAGSPELALAIGYAFSRNGAREHSLGQLLSYAPLLDKEQAAQMAVYLAQAPVADRADALAVALGSKNAAESALAASALALMDLSKFSRRFLAGYDAANADEKRAMLKVCESLADEYAFCEIARRLPAETEPALRAAMQRALLRISQSVFTTPMFDAVTEAHAKSKQEDSAAKTFWLRFAPLQGDASAIAFCARAHAGGLQGDAIKMLGAWKTPLALDALVSLAKEATDDRERLLAQISLVSLMERVGVQRQALDYLQKNAVREDIKKAASRLATQPEKK